MRIHLNKRRPHLKRFAIILTATWLHGFFVFCHPALASEEELLKKIELLEKRINTLEKKLAEHESCITDQTKCIEDQRRSIEAYKKKVEELGLSASLIRPQRAGINIGGFKIGAGLTVIGQYAVDANNVDTEKTADTVDGTMSADIGITKEIGDFGKAFLHLEYGQTGAPGVERDIMAYPFTNVNREANTSGFSVSEGWYEHSLFDKKFTFMIGKFDPTIYFDDSTIANDETTQFLGRMFRNNPAIEFPDDNAPGCRAMLIPWDMLELSAGVLNARASWERLDRDLFSIAQANVRLKFFGREGDYRFILWRNDKYHTKLTDSEMSKKDNYGYALCFDQSIMNPFTIFARFGMQNQSVSTVWCSWSAGCQFTGAPWRRKDDVLGFAVGQAIPGHDYKEAHPAYSADTQTNLEVYYNIKINNYLAVTPDYQVIWNPNGGDPDDRKAPISVFGLRGQLDF